MTRVLLTIALILASTAPVRAQGLSLQGMEPLIGDWQTTPSSDTSSATGDDFTVRLEVSGSQLTLHKKRKTSRYGTSEESASFDINDLSDVHALGDGRVSLLCALDKACITKTSKMAAAVFATKSKRTNHKSIVIESVGRSRQLETRMFHTISNALAARHDTKSRSINNTR